MKVHIMLGMNKLDTKTRAQILAMLCEGASMRSVSRLTDTSINTVSKLLVDAGRFCAGFHDAKVRGVKASKVQVDEIWSFTAAKQKNVASMKTPVDGAGDTWTWTAIEADTKLLISHFVGGRDGECAKWFIEDMASRITNRIQLTSDGHKAYLEAVEGAFGCDVDYAMLVKIYGNAPEASKGRYSPAECTGIKKTPIEGKPDLAHVSTSYVERQNLTMRMHNRRFTRLTNAFSKKFENHAHMVAIYAVWYNWIRIHKTLRVTPAMAAGISKTVMNWSDIVEMMDADQPAKKRGAYRKSKEFSV
jgi:IS1 family transposase/DNA-binding CsgD family transcriptional regulator